MINARDLGEGGVKRDVYSMSLWFESKTLLALAAIEYRSNLNFFSNIFFTLNVLKFLIFLSFYLVFNLLKNN